MLNAILSEYLVPGQHIYQIAVASTTYSQNIENSKITETANIFWHRRLGLAEIKPFFMVQHCKSIKAVNCKSVGAVDCHETGLVPHQPQV